MKIDFWFDAETGLYCSSFPLATLDGRLHLCTSGDVDPAECLRKLALCVDDRLAGDLLLSKEAREGVTR